MAVLTDSEIERGLESLEGWSRDGQTIVTDIQLADFDAAIALVNEIADAAQARDHHPDILLHGWNNVRLTLSTHSEGAITDKDLDLARAIDAIARA